MSDSSFDPVEAPAAGAAVLDLDASAADPARKRVTTTSATMRLIGAALLVVAASTFMLQHWADGNSTLRYLCLLAHTALLAAGGLVCGLRVRENRAARTFFALVLASVPVHFAALGGVLRSAFPLDRAYGSNDLWPISGPMPALVLLVLGAVALLPLTRIATTVLCRAHAKDLTRATLALNAVVLVPLRSPGAVALLCGALMFALFALDVRLARLGYAIHTPSARLVRVLLLAPPAIMIGRTLLWYQPSTVAYAAFSLCAALALFFGAPRFLGQGGPCAALQATATLAAVTSTAWMLAPLASSPHLAAGLGVPLIVLPSAALGFGLSFVTHAGGAFYRRVAATLSCLVLGANTLGCWHLELHTAAGLIALVAGIGVLLCGVYVQQRVVFIAGTGLALLGFAQVMSAAIELGSLANWQALSTLGAALIFGAALLERYAERLLHRASSLRARLSYW